MKLNDQFITVRANILMMNPMPTVSQAYRLFAQKERHKEVSQISAQTESLAFFTDRRRYNSFQSQRSGNGSNKTANTGFKFPSQSSTYNSGGGTGFGIGNGSNFKKGGKPNYFCNHCKIPGHSMERCFKLHGYPPGFSRDKKIVACS